MVAMGGDFKPECEGRNWFSFDAAIDRRSSFVKTQTTDRADCLISTSRKKQTNNLLKRRPCRPRFVARNFLLFQLARQIHS